MLSLASTFKRVREVEQSEIKKMEEVRTNREGIRFSEVVEIPWIELVLI